MVSYQSFELYQKILTLLASPEGASISELQHAVDRTPRTIHRILTAMQKNGIDVTWRHDAQGNTNAKRWCVHKLGASSPVPHLGCYSYLNLELRLAISRFGKFENDHTKTLTRMAKKTLAKTIQDGMVGTSARGEHFIYSTKKGVKDYTEYDEIIDKIYDCVINQKWANVTYRSPKSDSDKQYEICPLTIVEHQNALYVLVMVPKHDNNIATLAIERIRALSVCPKKRFTRPTGFNPEHVLSQAFGITTEEPKVYTIHFDPQVAVFGTERLWSKDQKVERHADGSATLTFVAGGYNEIKNWVLGFGASATVIEPLDLQHDILREAEAIVARSRLCSEA